MADHQGPGRMLAAFKHGMGPMAQGPWQPWAGHVCCPHPQIPGAAPDFKSITNLKPRSFSTMENYRT